MTFTLNDDSLTNKTDCVGNEQVVEMFKRHQHDYRLIDGCFHKNLEFHVSSSFSKQKKLTCSRKQKLLMYSNFAINNSVITGSMMAASTKTLQFISVTVS